MSCAYNGYYFSFQRLFVSRLQPIFEYNNLQLYYVKTVNYESHVLPQIRKLSGREAVFCCLKEFGAGMRSECFTCFSGHPELVELLWAPHKPSRCAF
jgi:hypothetical protein